MVLKVDRWNGWIFGLSSVKMERKDRLYWRHPKTKSPDETNRPNIDWIINMHLNLRHILLRGNTFRGRSYHRGNTFRGRGYHRGNTFRWNGCHSWGSCGILNCRFYPLSCTCRLLFCTWTCKWTWTPLWSQPNHPRTKELKRILVSSRVTNKVEIEDVSQTLSTFLTGMNFPNYLASLEKSSE